jgi:hypothetical protein
MNEQVLTATISGMVALFVAAITTTVAWAQIRREQQRQLADLKLAWALEVHKLRLSTYPAALEAVAPMSKFHGIPTAQTLNDAAARLNGWLYSAGGLCGDTTTRTAVTALRDICNSWAFTGETEPPFGFYEFRNLTIAFLRRDLEVDGRESHDKYGTAPLLTQLQRQMGISEPRKRSGRQAESQTYRDITLRVGAGDNTIEARRELLRTLLASAGASEGRPRRTR